MVRFHTVFDTVKGVQIDIPFTPEEENQRDREEAAHALAMKEDGERAARASTSRESAIGKLKRLGLTDDEIAAL